MHNQGASYQSGWLFLLLFFLPVATFSQIDELEFSSDESSPLTILRADFDRTWGYERRFLRNSLAMFYDNTRDPFHLNYLLQWHLEKFCDFGPDQELEELYEIIWERGARPLAINDRLLCSLKKSEAIIADTTLLGSLFELGLQADFQIDEGLRQHFPGNLIHTPEAWPTLQWAIKQGIPVYHPYRFDPLDLTFMPLFQQACLINAHDLIEWMLVYDRSLAYSPSIRYYGSEHSYFESPVSLVIKSFNGENEQEVLHTLRLLKGAKIDVLVEDFRGNSPLDYATNTEQEELISFMTTWIAESRGEWESSGRQEILEQTKGLVGPALDSFLIDTDFGPAIALALAVAMQDEILIKHLMEEGANPIKQYGRGHSFFGQTPFIHALFSGNESLAMTISSMLPDSTSEEQWWLNQALMKTVSIPLINFYDYYDHGHSPDFYGTRVSEFLLKRGAEPDLPLFIVSSCKKHHVGQLAFWLAQSDDTSNKYYPEATESAIEHGGASGDTCASMMIEAGIDPRHYIDWKKESLFSLACHHHQSLTLKTSLTLYPGLVQADMWLGRKDSQGYRNPLNIVINTLPAASFAGMPFRPEDISEPRLSRLIESVRVLIQHGANPDRIDVTGITPRENLESRTHLPTVILVMFED